MVRFSTAARPLRSFAKAVSLVATHPDEQHRAECIPNDFVCYAAEKDARHSAPPVSRHRNQVSPRVAGVIEDLLGCASFWLSQLDSETLAAQPLGYLLQVRHGCLLLSPEQKRWILGRRSCYRPDSPRRKELRRPQDDNRRTEFFGKGFDVLQYLLSKR